MTFTGVVRVNGAGFFEIDPDNADVAIQAAIDTLDDGGGVLDIYPAADGGTYKFSDAVISDKSNVRLNGNGSILGFNGSTSLYMFRVRGENWTFDGLNFLDTAASGLGTGTRRIISIEDAGSDGASNTTRIVNCHFTVTLATQTVRDYQCIAVSGNSSSVEGLRRGLFVSGCTFIAGVNSIPNTKYVTATTTPYGITFIKTDNSASQHIVNNEFRGIRRTSTLANVPDGGDDQLEEIAINATVAVGGETIVLKSTASDPSLDGVVQPGSYLTIAGDSQIYVVTKQATAGSDLVSLNIWPPLVVQADANDVVVLTMLPAYGHIAAAIHLTDHNQSIVHSNIFVLLSTQAAAQGEGGDLIHLAGVDGEAGHTRVAGNVCEDVDSRRMVRVESDGGAYPQGWNFIEHNKFGRIIPTCESLVSFLNATDCTVIGNNFHNTEGGLDGASPTSGHKIEIADSKSILIDHNTGSIMDSGEFDEVWHDSGGNQNIRVMPGNVLEVTI
jgi:hypothetical protein